MRKMMILTFALVAALFSAIIAPTFAAAPTEVNDVWFVIPIFVNHPIPAGVSITPDKVWTSDDGTVIHSRNTEISTYIAHTPPALPPGSIRWGTMVATSDFVFNTLSNTGTFTMKITLTLTDSVGTGGYVGADYPNTYGVGTLEGTLVAKVTSLNTFVASNLNCPMPGNGEGYFVATHGTGAFENAKLTADVTLEPGSALGGAVGIEYLFVGDHINHLYNDGALKFHHPGPLQ